jgi:formylglycine-generating enzyme required for sulfatase activity
VPEGFVRIPAGSFTMSERGGGSGWEPGGDEVPHKVEISRAFYLQATEVTQSQWDGFVKAKGGKNPSYFASCGRDCPVEGVNWWEALSYSNWLSDLENLEHCYELSGCRGTLGDDFKCTGYSFEGLGCKGYRLPTEAEWEWASRGGKAGKLAVYTGDLNVANYKAPELDAIAVYYGNRVSGTAKVKSKKPNGYGLYDMLGNVWEWTHDAYESNLGGSEQKDPVKESGGSRVVRGCSWLHFAQGCRLANRGHYAPVWRFNYLGFRPARSLP